MKGKKKEKKVELEGVLNPQPTSMADDKSVSGSGKPVVGDSWIDLVNSLQTSGGSDMEFTSARAIEDHALALHPLGRGCTQKGFAGIGDAGVSRIIVSQRLAIGCGGYIHRLLIVEVERRAIAGGQFP